MSTALLKYDLRVIESHLEEIANNHTLLHERNFNDRIDAIDFIEFQIIDEINARLHGSAERNGLRLLKRRAEKVKYSLEAIDDKLFQRLQRSIQATRYTGQEFKQLINEYCGTTYGAESGAGYDNLDIFINRLLPIEALPDLTKPLEPGMVYYQKTPVRIVLQLVEIASFRKEDVFYDLGSGLGQVAILVNMLAGIKTIGIEIEPAFCEAATHCANRLKLKDITFLNTDARNADYADGTVFFMFTPFTGDMLEAVLVLLRDVSLSRKIKIITYGPCTAAVAIHRWLTREGKQEVDTYKLSVFSSL